MELRELARERRRIRGPARNVLEPARDDDLSGAQIHPSCCWDVFLEESAESVATVELVWRVREET
jgi:hypothetical protein